VAVDAAGNVYVADSGKNRVLKLAAASSTQTVLPSTNGTTPNDVAVDSADTVYTSVFTGNGRYTRPSSDEVGGDSRGDLARGADV
jgi:serine/threonine-protein kinase